MKHLRILSSRSQRPRKGDKTWTEITIQMVGSDTCQRTHRQVTSQRDILEERKRGGGGEGNGAGPTRLSYSDQVTMGLPLETRKVGGASFAAPGPHPSLPSFGTTSLHPRLPSYFTQAS